MSIPVSPSPQEPILQTDQDNKPLPEGLISSSWYLFLQNLIVGDTGQTSSSPWVPVATNLTFAGSPPVITGNYYQNEGFTDFWIRIVPGTSTTSTAGTTYFDLPFAVTVDGACIVGGLPGAVGLIDAATKRCFPPPWSAVTANITISGRVVSI